jgi:hypothetical protein
VARLECGDDGTTITREVRPEADGVHFEVVNPGDTALMFDLVGSDRGLAQGAEPGESAVIVDLAPGDYTAKCYAEDELHPETIAGAPLTVTDQDGVWSEIAVSCPEGTEPSSAVLDYPMGVSGEEGTPEEIARRHLGTSVQDGDEVRRAGYQAAQNPYVVVVRDGRIVGQVSLIAVIEGGYIAQTITTCEGVSMPPEG